MNFALKILGKAISISCLYFAVCFSTAYAHPMPNTEIAIRLDEAFVNLEIKIPVAELVLAFPKSEAINAENIASESREKVEAYFRKHIKVSSKNGTMQSFDITSLKIEKSVDEFVGEYQELILTVEIPVKENFNPRDFLFEYDAVIHQVPNHFALVKITQDFEGGVLEDEKAFAVGAIRYDFAKNSVPPLAVTANEGGIFRGFRAMVALGMHHILVGLDHILFLLTLLIVAPVTVEDGKWSLFQGVGYTLRRFLKISLAFTLGHSAALVFGAYNFLPVNEKLIEVLIAASILLTATHAVRPLFPKSEVFVALGFGTVHGLAFSESLKSLQLAPMQKAISIFGFNLGIELMQVIIMAIAFPVLLVSRHKIYHFLRITVASGAFILALVWMMERITGSKFLD